MRVTRHTTTLGGAMVALAIALWAALPGTAAADTVSYQVGDTVPIAMATDNPCTGEPVSLTGTYHCWPGR